MLKGVSLRPCVCASGVGAVGGSKHRAEVSDRGTEAGTSASHPHAQPPPSHLHRPQGQCPVPREREEPAAGAHLGFVRRSGDLRRTEWRFHPQTRSLLAFVEFLETRHSLEASSFVLKSRKLPK